jgi:peptide/nickel transport system substrate-binding protein
MRLAAVSDLKEEAFVNKRGRVFAFTLPLLLGMLLAACGSTTTAPAVTPPYKYTVPATHGGTVVYSDWQFPDSLNILFAGSVVDIEVLDAIFGAPVAISSDGKFIPDQLLEVPTQANGDVSKDGLTLTMKLRHDLKWSDGQPLTADDYVYFLNTLLDPATAPVSTFGFEEISSIVATDTYTVTLKYKEVFAPYLTFLPFALPKHLWGSIPNGDLANTPDVNLAPKISSGPYVLSDYAADQSFTMVPNKNYTSTSFHPAVLDKVIFKGYQSKDALIAGYQAGETDHAEDFTLADLQKLNGLPGFHISPNIAYEHLDFNLQNPVLQDGNVRKAIEEAIDRCQIIQSVLNQKCSDLGVDSILPAPSPEYDPSIKAFGFDLNQAKADMQTAGWNCSSGTCKKADGTAFPTLNLVTTSGNQQRADVTQIVKQDLAALGININLDGQYYPAGTLFGDYGHGGILATGKYDLSLFAFTFGIDSGSSLSTFQSSEIPSDAHPAGGNFERVNDPQVDQLLKEANSTLDIAKRHDLIIQLQKYLIEHVYVIPMYLRPNLTLTTPNIGNYFDNPTAAGNMWNVGDWYLVKKSS